MNKRFSFIFALLLIGIGGLFIFFKNSQIVMDGTPVEYSIFEGPDGYREYAFGSGDDIDAGFTHRVLEYIQTSADMRIKGATITGNGETMKYVRPTDEDRKRGVIEKHSAGTDVYELRSNDKKTIGSTYSVFKNDELLFSDSMDFGSDGPILDWRIVGGEPAFTYRTGCDPECSTELFYGGLVGKMFGVTNPRYLFVHNDKVGFVAEDEGADRIYYDGNFITPAFDSIHTHNCCALNEILPTIYSNGVLLFYGKRDDQNYLVETTLK